MDFETALRIVDSAVLQIQEMRKIPNTIIEQAIIDWAEWRATRICLRRMIDGESNMTSQQTRTARLDNKDCCFAREAASFLSRKQ